jgi:hypothetical protein
VLEDPEKNESIYYFGFQPCHAERPQVNDDAGQMQISGRELWAFRRLNSGANAVAGAVRFVAPVGIPIARDMHKVISFQYP